MSNLSRLYTNAWRSVIPALTRIATSPENAHAFYKYKFQNDPHFKCRKELNIARQKNNLT